MFTLHSIFPIEKKRIMEELLGTVKSELSKDELYRKYIDYDNKDLDILLSDAILSSGVGFHFKDTKGTEGSKGTNQKGADQKGSGSFYITVNDEGCIVAKISHSEPKLDIYDIVMADFLNMLHSQYRNLYAYEKYKVKIVVYMNTYNELCIEFNFGYKSILDDLNASEKESLHYVGSIIISEILALRSVIKSVSNNGVTSIDLLTTYYKLSRLNGSVEGIKGTSI